MDKSKWIIPIVIIILVVIILYLANGYLTLSMFLNRVSSLYQEETEYNIKLEDYRTCVSRCLAINGYCEPSDTYEECSYNMHRCSDDMDSCMLACEGYVRNR